MFTCESRAIVHATMRQLNTTK